MTVIIILCLLGIIVLTGLFWSESRAMGQRWDEAEADEDILEEAVTEG